MSASKGVGDPLRRLLQDKKKAFVEASSKLEKPSKKAAASSRPTSAVSSQPSTPTRAAANAPQSPLRIHSSPRSIASLSVASPSTRSTRSSQADIDLAASHNSEQFEVHRNATDGQLASPTAFSSSVSTALNNADALIRRLTSQSPNASGSFQLHSPKKLNIEDQLNDSLLTASVVKAMSPQAVDESFTVQHVAAPTPTAAPLSPMQPTRNRTAETPPSEQNAQVMDGIANMSLSATAAEDAVRAALQSARRLDSTSTPESSQASAPLDVSASLQGIKPSMWASQSNLNSNFGTGSFMRSSLSSSLMSNLAASTRPLSTPQSASTADTPLITPAPPTPSIQLSVAASSDKLKSIISFLDEVDEQTNKDTPLLTSFRPAVSALPPSVATSLANTAATPSPMTPGVPAEPAAKPKASVSARSSPAHKSGKPPKPHKTVAETPAVLATPTSGAMLFATPAIAAGNATPSAIDVTAGAGHVNSVFDEIRAKMQALRQQLEAKTQANAALQTQLDRAQDARLEAEREHARALKLCAHTERQKSEAQLQRTLEFSDKLLKDKDELSARLEAAMNDLKAADTKIERRVEETGEQFARELKRERDAWAAAEKVRREQWMAKESRACLDRTRKALEPEIQRLIDANKDSLRRAEQEAADALQRQREQLLMAAHAELGQARTIAAQERDEALARERELQQQRVRDVMERQETQLQQLRTRFVGELDQERAHAAAEARRVSDAHEDAMARVRRECDERLANSKQQHQLELDAANRRTESAVTMAKEQFRVEREQWQAQVRAKLERELRAKEVEMEQRLRAERDAELEAVVNKLQEETAAERTAWQQQQSRSQTSAQRAWTEEAAQLRQNEAEWMQKFMNASKAQLEANDRAVAAESRLAGSTVQLDERDKRISQLEALVARLETESRALNQTAAQQRDKEQAQLARLASQYERTLSEVRAEAHSKFDAYEASISQAEQRRVAEMDEIESKVRSITSKKDDQIAALREALRARDARVLQIETLLEHQRQELGGM